MNTHIVSDSLDAAKCNPVRVFGAESYLRWCELTSLEFYSRTSPRNNVAKYSHLVQNKQMEECVRQRNSRLRIAWHVCEIGIDGHSLASKHRTEFWNMVLRCQGNRQRAILTPDLTRLLRPVKRKSDRRSPAEQQARILQRLSTLGVDFITVLPLQIDDSDLHSLRVQAADAERTKQQAIGYEAGLAAFLSYYFDHQSET